MRERTWGTVIFHTGLLMVDHNESAETLTGRALSALDHTKSGTALVTVAYPINLVYIKGIPKA